MTIESILERIAVSLEALATVHAGQALDNAEAPSQQVTTNAPAAQTQAPPSQGRKPRATKASTESAQSAATPASQAASAPAASQAAQSPAAQTVANPSELLKVTTDTIIALANEYDRDQALAILAKRRGVTRCSDLKPEEYQGVLDEARAAIQAAKSSAGAASLI